MSIYDEMMDHLDNYGCILSGRTERGDHQIITVGAYGVAILSRIVPRSVPAMAAHMDAVADAMPAIRILQAERGILV